MTRDEKISARMRRALQRMGYSVLKKYGKIPQDDGPLLEELKLAYQNIFLHAVILGWIELDSPMAESLDLPQPIEIEITLPAYHEEKTKRVLPVIEIDMCAQFGHRWERRTLENSRQFYLICVRCGEPFRG